MSCFSAISLRSLLPRWAQSLMPVQNDSPSTWNIGERSKGDPDRAASNSTTSYTRSEVATYNPRRLSNSRDLTASSDFLQLKSGGAPTSTPHTAHEPFSTPIHLDAPPSIITRPHISRLPIDRRSLEIGYFNRTGPSKGSNIWSIEPCKPMAQEQRTLAVLDTKRLADIPEFERVIDDWFSKKENPIFQIRVEDVAEYATASTSSFGGEEVKNDLCETLNASLLDAPKSIVEKLMDKDDLKSVIVVVKLIVNGFLPPPGLYSSILGIFLAGDGIDLTNHLLESQTMAADRFRENMGKLLD